MEQVSGRAGRKDKQGSVIIQVSNPRHPVLHYVQQHDYKLFFEEEIKGRQQFYYPPFSRYIQITLRHRYKDVVDGAADRFAKALKGEFPQNVVGPGEPVVNRIRNQYLMELSLKMPKEQAVLQKCKKLIQDQIALMHQDSRFKSVVAIIDVDAM